MTHWVFPPGRGREPGPHSVRDARGEGSGDLGQLSVPREGQQTQHGQRQRLPHPVVPPQLYSQQVSGTRVTALGWELGSYLSSLQHGEEILSVRRAALCPSPRLLLCLGFSMEAMLTLSVWGSVSPRYMGLAPQPVVCVCLIPFQLQGQGERRLRERHREAGGEPQPVQHCPVPHRAGNSHCWIQITARRAGLHGVCGPGGWARRKGTD